MVSFFFQPQNFSHPRLYDYPPVQEDTQRLHFLILQFTFPPLQKFFAMDFISNCEQIPMLLLICSHLLKRSLMEISFFCNVSTTIFLSLLLSVIHTTVIYHIAFKYINTLMRSYKIFPKLIFSDNIETLILLLLIQKTLQAQQTKKLLNRPSITNY